MRMRQPSPSGSTATMPVSMTPGRRCRTPAFQSSAVIARPPTARPSQSPPGTTRLAMPGVPSGSVTRSSVAPLLPPAEARGCHRVDPVARDHVAREMQVVTAAHAVARGGQRGAGGPLARAPLADLAGAVPPRGELGGDRVAPVAAHAAAGQRGLEHGVARVGRRQRIDVAGRHRGAQCVEGAAHGSTSALIASPLRASSSARPVSSQPDAVRDEGQRIDLRRRR